MKFISLIDAKNQNIVTIDVNNFLLRLEIDGNCIDTRLKPYMASVLYQLFSNHPTPLSYDCIIKILKEYNLIINDSTRMHRKLSEIRQFILNFHPSLDGYLLNIRGIGYSLPLRLKNLHKMSDTQANTKFKNVKLTNLINILYELINDSITITIECKVIKYDQGYIINRSIIADVLIKNIDIFDECKASILKEIPLHAVDFKMLRITYILAKLRTYIGLARISEYPISETQWLDWFTQEIWFLFEELKRLIKSIENI